MTDTEQHESRVLQNDNSNFFNESILHLRLNTEPILTSIEHYLKGEFEQYIETENGIEKQTIQFSDAKCNTHGIGSIMSWLRGTLNSQVVQGNFENFEQLHSYLEGFRLQLAEHLMINLHNYEISETDFEGICDMILSLMHPFMSRLVNNKERDSYAQTIQTMQKSDTVMNSKKSMPFM